MLSLIMAGEAIFFLPFILARVFRPTLLLVFDINNYELGLAFSAYGVVAMVAYFLGGPLADRFSAKYLLPLAMVSTAAGGLVFATIPSLGVLKLLYAFWGLTTILLFWAALMRATRAWGGESAPGRAFGWLDGGRGLMAALIGTVGVAVFAQVMPPEGAAISLAQRSEALKQVILLTTGIVFGVAVLVWAVLPRQQAGPASTGWSLADLKRVLRLPTVWLQAVIIVCAYVGYKGTDDFSLYAQDVLGLDEVNAAQVGTISLWVRPFAAVLAGLLADRVGVSRMMLVSFALLMAGSVVLSAGWLHSGLFAVFFFTLVGTSAGVHALRGLYFAVMQEARVPMAITGTAVGLVSVLGYTPDVFFGPLMGWLLDRTPGPVGHQQVFAVVGGFASLGLLATLAFRRLALRNTPLSGTETVV
jgi:MFS family permease